MVWQLFVFSTRCSVLAYCVANTVPFAYSQFGVGAVTFFCQLGQFLSGKHWAQIWLYNILVHTVLSRSGAVCCLWETSDQVHVCAPIISLHHEKLGDPRGFYSCAWMEFVNSRYIIGLRSEEYLFPIQDMYRSSYLGKPHEGNCCSAIRLALHTTSYSAENYSRVVAEKWILYCELFAISMFWPYKQKIRTLGLLSSEADFCTVNILFLPRRTTDLTPWPPPYSSSVALQFPSSRPIRVITAVTGNICHISAVIGTDGSEHFLRNVAWLLCDYIFCSSIAADQFCKDTNVQEKGRYA